MTITQNSASVNKHTPPQTGKKPPISVALSITDLKLQARLTNHFQKNDFITVFKTENSLQDHLTRFEKKRQYPTCLILDEDTFSKTLKDNRQLYYRTKILVVYEAFNTLPNLQEVFRLGGSGVISKNTSNATWLYAIHVITQKKQHFVELCCPHFMLHFMTPAVMHYHIETAKKENCHEYY